MGSEGLTANYVSEAALGSPAAEKPNILWEKNKWLPMHSNSYTKWNTSVVFYFIFSQNTQRQ